MFLRDQCIKKSHWIFWSLLVNFFVFMIIGTRYLTWIHSPDLETSVYIFFLYLGQFSLFAILLSPILYVVLSILPRKLGFIVTSLLSSLVLIFMYVDTVVYDLYRFHFSGFIIEMALLGGKQVFDFHWGTWLFFVTFLLVLFLSHFFATSFFSGQKLKKTFLTAFCFLAFVCQASVHLWHAYADATYNGKITAVTPHLPLYYGMTAKRFFRKAGLIDFKAVRKDYEIADLAVTKKLSYPIKPLVCEEPQNKPNILMVVVDTLRADMLNEKWMPHVHNFSKSAQNFSNHFSNGNVTKSGIFSLFYGLPANYWDAFTAEKMPPILIDRLQDLDYEMKILGSATLISPSFSMNVFSSIKDLSLSTAGNTPWERDVTITEDWLSFTEQHVTSSTKPFFGFLFYDTPHSPDIPEDYPKFNPFWEKVNYLELDNKFNSELYLNVYRTTVHFTDSLIKKVLEDLKQKNLLDNTIVVITSDHGKEFNDNKKNYWGYGSNYTDYQLGVPLVVHWPGKKPHKFLTRTEHFDIAPTLIQSALGCPSNDTRTFSSGGDLFNDDGRKWSIAHSYVNFALLFEEILLVRHPAGHVEVMNSDLSPAENYSIPPHVVRDVLSELSRFYKL